MTDPLSDALRSVRLIGGLFLDVRLTQPWAVISQITPDDCRDILAKPAQIISYHVALEGRFLLSIEGEPTMTVEAGEIVLMPRNDVHTLASEPGVAPVFGNTLIQPSPNGGLARIAHGGPGPLTHMVCGFLGSEDPANPLLASLPRALKLPLKRGTERDWIEASVRFAASELAAGRLASSGVMSRLSEVLLVEAVRNYAASHGDRAEGWLRGLCDPQIGRALALLHGDIRASWSAETLARAVALSRSAFVDRFTTLVGIPPIRYLTEWRMKAATLQLRETAKSIGQIAFAVGYDSEEAFSRAFKRELGVPPSAWRAGSRADAQRQ